MSRFAIETNQFQKLMLDNLKERAEHQHVDLNLWKIDSRTNKQQRIAGLQPQIVQGRVIFCRRHKLLLNQLYRFPAGKHDDGPDALEMAVAAALKGSARLRRIQTARPVALMFASDCGRHVGK